MAGGLGGMGGFGSTLQALGLALLSSPRGAPFQNLPQTLAATREQARSDEERQAMALVAQKLGLPPELAANSAALSLFIQQQNQARSNAQLDDYLKNGGSNLVLPDGGAAPPGGSPGGGSASGPIAPSFAAPGSGRTMVSPLAAVDPVAADLPPHQKALLNGIARPESGGKYNIRYTPGGGVTFAGFSTHPGIFERTKTGERSSASGRYQFTKTTWDDLMGADAPFTPENQDRAAIALAQRDYRSRTGRDLDADLQRNGLTPQIAKVLAPTWQGLGVNPSSAIAEYNSSFLRYAGGPTQGGDATAGAAAHTVQGRPYGPNGEPLTPPSYQVASSGPVAVPRNAPPLPSQPPAVPATGNRTQDIATQQVNLALGRIVAAEQAGNKGIVEAEKAKLHLYMKYLEPLEAVRRVEAAGLAGTPLGNAIVAGAPADVQQHYAEQSTPGYVAPGTLAVKKEMRETDQQAWERVQREREFAEKQAESWRTNEQKDARFRTTNPELARVADEAAAARAGATTAATTAASKKTEFSAAATAGAQAAAGMADVVSQAKKHLEDVVNLQGYGPLAASKINRRMSAALPDIPGITTTNKAEIARQKFDQTMATLGAARAAAVNKMQGGGNMSATEQVLARADLPSLTSADPQVAKDALKQLESEIRRAKELDAKYGLFQGEQQPPPAAPPADASAGSPPKILTKAEYDKLPSGRTFIDPKGDLRVKP